MSEPLSAVEIEDVLSSIRRLVSEDLRPALRVVPDAEPLREAKAAMPIEDVVATVSAGVEPQEWESETGDAGIEAEPVWADAAWDMPVAAVAVPVLAGDVTDGDVLESDVLDGDVLDREKAAGNDAAPGWAQAGAEDISVEAVAEPMHEPAADAEWVERAEAEVIAGLEQTRAEDTFEFSQTDAELSFDEEVLRDLVRDLIREELQGDLGERITRNIRKLVRAEIARALAVQDLV